MRDRESCAYRKLRPHCAARTYARHASQPDRLRCCLTESELRSRDGIVSGIVFFVRALLSNRAAIAAENLALRQQLGVMQRSVKRPRLRQLEQRSEAVTILCDE